MLGGGFRLGEPAKTRLNPQATKSGKLCFAAMVQWAKKGPRERAGKMVL